MNMCLTRIPDPPKQQISSKEHKNHNDYYILLFLHGSVQTYLQPAQQPRISSPPGAGIIFHEFQAHQAPIKWPNIKLGTKISVSLTYNSHWEALFRERMILTVTGNSVQRVQLLKNSLREFDHGSNNSLILFQNMWAIISTRECWQNYEITVLQCIHLFDLFV